MGQTSEVVMAFSLLNSYARHWRMQGRADTTLATYLNSLRLFIRDVLGGDEAGLVDVDRAPLEAYVECRMVEVSANSASNDVRAFKSFYRWAEEEDEVDVNPAKRLKHPRVDEPPVKVATDDDLERLLGVCGRDMLGRRDAAMIALLAYAGLRRAELCVLDLEHVDLDEGRLTIPKTKSGRPRTVPLHAEVVARLDRYMRSRGERPGPLFVPHRGGRMRPNGVGQMMERRAKAAGADVRAHAFRRRFATEYLRRGGGEVALQALGGWSSKAMIASYTRMDREVLAADEYRRVMA